MSLTNTLSATVQVHGNTEGEGVESTDVPTVYFLAGGRARSPSLKLEAYFSFAEVRFCWTSEDIAERFYFDYSVMFVSYYIPPSQSCGNKISIPDSFQ
jgi:hypothetical protein